MRLRSVLRSSITARIVAIGFILALTQLLVAEVIAEGEATGHAWFHVLFFALPALVVAAGVIVLWPNAGLASRIPVIGLLALAAAQLIESVGAMGFAADNDARVSGIVVLHDLGLGLSAIGMIAAILGLGVGSGLASWRLRGRRGWIGLAATAVGLAGGLLLVLTLTGMSPFGG